MAHLRLSFKLHSWKPLDIHIETMTIAHRYVKGEVVLRGGARPPKGWEEAAPWTEVDYQCFPHDVGPFSFAVFCIECILNPLQPCVTSMQFAAAQTLYNAVNKPGHWIRQLFGQRIRTFLHPQKKGSTFVVKLVARELRAQDIEVEFSVAGERYLVTKTCDLRVIQDHFDSKIGTPSCQIDLAARPIVVHTPATCNQNEFDVLAREYLLQERMLLTGLPFATCVYPGCDATEPDDTLECHSVRTVGDVDGCDCAILLCSRHHLYAHRKLISAKDCFAFKRGINPFAWLARESVDDLWARLQSLSEFSSPPRKLSPRERWHELSGILFAARHHKDKNNSRRLLLCAWILSEMAAFLTVHIPGRKPSEPRQTPSRLEIDDRIRESMKYNEHAQDEFLYLVRNPHVFAVNANALLDFNSSAEKFATLYDGYAITDVQPNSAIPIDHARYRSYLVRQYASVSSKCADIIAVDLAKQAVVMAADLDERVRETDTNEALARFLQAAVLLDQEELANELGAMVAAVVDAEQGIRKVIGCKILAAWSLRRADDDDTEHFLKIAKTAATEGEMAHQLGQLESMEQLLEMGQDLRFGSGGIDPSRGVI